MRLRLMQRAAAPRLRGRTTREDRLMWAVFHSSKQFVRLTKLGFLGPVMAGRAKRHRREVVQFTRTSPRWHQLAGTHHKITGLHAAIKRAQETK